MKNIILIAIIISITFFGCKKKPQAWSDIQGTWDIEQCLINGVDSTAKIKGYCYEKINIAYFGKDQKDGDKLLHIYDFGNHDYGELNLEVSDYKKMQICKLNLNRTIYCPEHPLANLCIEWDIILISASTFEIKTTFNQVSYNVKYKKI